MNYHMRAKRLHQRKQGNKRPLATKKPQRGFKAAPPLLGKIIDLVNLVRPEDPLSPLDYHPPELPPPTASREDVEAHNERTAAFREETEALLDRLTENTPLGFQEYVFQKERSPVWFLSEAAIRYEFVRESRENLRLIARGPTLLMALRSTLYIWRDQAGKLTQAPDRFRAALDQDGVDLDCIRECAVCGVIYYEDRLTYQGKRVEPACLLHGQTLRSRRNYRPVKTDEVEAFLAENPDCPRTVESIRDGIDATERQIRLALDYLKRKSGLTPASKR
jgi:hypothetical protein